eukprot:184774_1
MSNVSKVISKTASSISHCSVARNLDNYGLPQPIYYKSSHKKWIILSTPAPVYNNKNGVYIYDISNNNWTLFCKYPRAFQLKKRYNHVLDEKANILYIFDGKFQHVAALNLKTKTWNVQNITSTFGRSHCDITYIVSPKHTIHALTNNGHHFQHDKSNKITSSFVTLPPYDDVFNVNLFKIIYVKSMAQILAIRVFQPSIMYCQFSNSNKQNLYEWKEYPLKLLINTWINTVSLIHDHILVIEVNIIGRNNDISGDINGHNNDRRIYCVDLRYKNIVRTIKGFPKSSDSIGYLIDSHDGMIHCFNKSKHVEWADQFIPNEWHKQYRNTFDKLLVTAYTKSYRDMNIPTCISDIIWLYYPGYLNYVN